MSSDLKKQFLYFVYKFLNCFKLTQRKTIFSLPFNAQWMLLHRQRLLMVCVTRRNSAKQETRKCRETKFFTHTTMIETKCSTHWKVCKNFSSLYSLYSHIVMFVYWDEWPLPLYSYLHTINAGLFYLFNSIFVEALMHLLKRRSRCVGVS